MVPVKKWSSAIAPRLCHEVGPLRTRSARAVTWPGSSLAAGPRPPLEGEPCRLESEGLGLPVSVEPLGVQVSGHPSVQSVEHDGRGRWTAARVIEGEATVRSESPSRSGSRGVGSGVYQCTPLKTLASMICSDSRAPCDPSPLAAAES